MAKHDNSDTRRFLLCVELVSRNFLQRSYYVSASLRAHRTKNLKSVDRSNAALSFQPPRSVLLFRVVRLFRAETHPRTPDNEVLATTASRFFRGRKNIGGHLGRDTTDDKNTHGDLLNVPQILVTYVLQIPRDQGATCPIQRREVLETSSRALMLRRPLPICPWRRSF